VSPRTAAEGLSTILLNFEENSRNWKIPKTVYDFIKAEKVPEPKLLWKTGFAPAYSRKIFGRADLSNFETFSEKN
jgi:hypothetical protein